MRYFFHLRTPEGVVPDPEGHNFSDRDQARTHAEYRIQELAREGMATGSALEVVDAQGQHVLRLTIVV